MFFTCFNASGITDPMQGFRTIGAGQTAVVRHPPPSTPETAQTDLFIDRRPIKGRGAGSNRSGRFEAQERFAVDDGWTTAEPRPVQQRFSSPPPDGPSQGLESPADACAIAQSRSVQTTVTWDASRSVIARNDSPDLGFDRSVNPYRGCEHGCVYCFARPSHAYLGLSSGLDFETRIVAKANIAERLDAELRKPGYRPDVLVLGANTDPYQPLERRLTLTRDVLEVLRAFRHPVVIVTKGALVTRDLDILAEMAAENLAAVAVSVTTLDNRLAARLEPRASAPAKRLDTIRRLAEAKIPVAVFASPMIPALNDWELERILDAARGAGAVRASYTMLRLPHELKELMQDWLETHAPGKAKHVLSLVREMHDGKLYDSTFGTRFRGTGPYAEMLHNRFTLACRRLGLATGAMVWPLDRSRFAAPPKAGDQLALL